MQAQQIHQFQLALLGAHSACFVSLHKASLSPARSITGCHRLDARVAELKAIKNFTALAISSSKKVTALCTALNRMRKHVAVFQAW